MSLRRSESRHIAISASPAPPYAQWLSQLRCLAEERELSWIVGTGPEAHRAAYDQGLTPDEELAALADIGQWRGCGCGGS